MTRIFNRHYELSITVNGSDTLIVPPIRIDFNASKSISGQLNKMILNIYNLNPAKRLSLVKDVEDSIVIPLSIFVGYQNKLGLIFKGTISRCSNDRKGADIITSIRCFDGGSDFFNSFISRTVKKNEIAIDTIIEELPRINKGKISERPVLTRPRVLVGSPAKLLNNMLDEEERWFIDNETLNILDDKDVIGSYIPEVSSKTGLINTPQRESSRVTFKMIIAPLVKIGSRVSLKSVVAPHLNGVYKIEDINYNGDNYGDEWSQTCTGVLKTDVTVI